MTKTITKSLRIKDRRIQYFVRVSQSATKARIKVSRDGVEVIVPQGAQNGKAAEFLRASSSWVLDQLDFVRRAGSLRSTQRSVPANSVLLRGRRTKLRVIEEESDRRYGLVEEHGVTLHIRVPRSGAVDPSRTLEAWLRRLAKQEIKARLTERCREMRRRPGRIYIMDQRTKWGGCSRRRNLSFNWRLVLAPPEVLDYIVVHEIAHLAEPYHSPKFWLIVRSHCPDFEACKTWLRNHYHQLRFSLGARG